MDSSKQEKEGDNAVAAMKLEAETNVPEEFENTFLVRLISCRSRLQLRKFLSG